MASKNRWDSVYDGKSEAELSWHEDDPATSFEIMRLAGLRPSSSVIDVGGGTSRIADQLLAKGVKDVSVLDLSESALILAQERLGADRDKIKWIVADVTQWAPSQMFDIWHDRAVFHFLVEASDRAAYIQRLSDSLNPDGHAIIATFAPDGPERCSGLPVARYSPESLADTLGEGFVLLTHRYTLHHTPLGKPQAFQYSLLRRNPSPTA